LDKKKSKKSKSTKWYSLSQRRDLTEELKDFPKATQYDLADFSKMNFETKKVVHVPLKFIS
jgi:16S rRNA (guanine527-N7)-methyltransferase